jgi:two-component system, NarL family, nitrate/nitrite response regulator NarL
MVEGPTSLLRLEGATTIETRGPEPVRVAIVSEIRLYRDGLAQMLAADERFEVVGTMTGCDEGFARIAESLPDVVLIDLAALDGPALVEELVLNAPRVKVLALSVREAEADIIALAEAGVAGFVTRDATLDELLERMECAARGEALCSPRTIALLLRRVAVLSGERRHATTVYLTSRERQVLDLVDQGFSNKEIAHELTIQVATVKNHVHNILYKLHVSRRGEAVAVVRGMRSVSSRARGLEI